MSVRVGGRWDHRRYQKPPPTYRKAGVQGVGNHVPIQRLLLAVVVSQVHAHRKGVLHRLDRPVLADRAETGQRFPESLEDAQCQQNGHARARRGRHEDLGAEHRYPDGLARPDGGRGQVGLGHQATAVADVLGQAGRGFSRVQCVRAPFRDVAEHLGQGRPPAARLVDAGGPPAAVVDEKHVAQLGHV